VTKQDGISNSDIATSAGRELIDGLGDLAEAGLDAAPFDQILDEIPVIKTLIGLHRTYRVIREGLYAKKLQDFFRAAAKSSGPSKMEREEALINFGGKDNRQRLGETLILLLDKADDMCKPKLHGYIIGYLLNGRLAYDEAMTLCAIVDRIILEDLNILASISSPISISGDGAELSAIHRLQANGLLYQSVFNGNWLSEDPGQGFSLTSVGQQLLMIYTNMQQDLV